MQMCWRIKASERPTFTQLLSKFDDMLATRADYVTAMDEDDKNAAALLLAGDAAADADSIGAYEGGDYDQCMPLTSITEVDPSDIYTSSNTSDEDEFKSSVISDAVSGSESSDAQSLRSDAELKETDGLMEGEDRRSSGVMVTEADGGDSDTEDGCVRYTLPS